MKAVVLGGTGATGRRLIGALLESDAWAQVTAVGRREVVLEGTDHSEENKKKLVNVVANLDALQEVKDSFVGHNVCFNCLGTTRGQAGGAAAFVKVEVTFCEAAAKVAKDAGIRHFSLVSAKGANSKQWGPSWCHPLLYVKTLGQKEQAAVQEKFQCVSIFRPGMLEREMDKKEAGYRWHEGLASKLLSGLKVSVLAQAMMADAEKCAADTTDSESETVVYEDKMIRELVASL